MSILGWIVYLMMAFLALVLVFGAGGKSKSDQDKISSAALFVGGYFIMVIAGLVSYL